MLHDPAVRQYLQDHFGNAKDQLQSGNQPSLRPGATYAEMPGTLGYQAGSSAYDFASRRPMLGSVGNFMTGLGRDPVGSAAKGALAGGVIGGGMGVVRRNGHPIRNAVIGAGLGAGGALLLSRLMQFRDGQNNNLRALAMNKTAFFGMPGGPDSVQFIQTRLFGDYSMAPGDKSMLMGLLPNLSHDQQQTLSGMLRGASGAGAGFVIAKYLLGLGLGGQGLMALVGGAASLVMGGLPRNVFGQRTDVQNDAFGRRRLV